MTKPTIPVGVQPPTPPLPPAGPFETWIEGAPTCGDWDWGNTVSVGTITCYLPGQAVCGAANEPDDNPEEDPDASWFADSHGERQLVQIDTNYKAGPESEYPADLTRTAAAALAVAVLTAIEDTFHRTRLGQLRPGEAAELLHSLEEVDYALASLRSHALTDLTDGITGRAGPHLFDQDVEPDHDEQDADDPGPSASAQREVSGSEPTTGPATPPAGAARPLSWDQQVSDAVKALFPADVAHEITTGEAFGALTYRLSQHCHDTGNTPGRALEQIEAGDRAFASRADIPAAFLARKVTEL